MSTPPSVLAIMGPPYCGGTIVGALLAGSPGTVALGESRWDDPCRVCADPATCPVWGANGCGRGPPAGLYARARAALGVDTVIAGDRYHWLLSERLTDADTVSVLVVAKSGPGLLASLRFHSGRLGTPLPPDPADALAHAAQELAESLDFARTRADRFTLCDPACLHADPATELTRIRTALGLPEPLTPFAWQGGHLHLRGGNLRALGTVLRRRAGEDLPVVSERGGMESPDLPGPDATAAVASPYHQLYEATRCALHC